MRIIALIIAIAAIGRSHQGIISCTTAVAHLTSSLFKMVNDISKDGMWFDKEDMMINFNNFQTLFLECSGKVPELFKLKPCIEHLKVVLENQDFMYYSVLDEEYDKAFQRFLDNSDPMIQMMNVCVNSASLLPFNPIPKNAERIQRLLTK